MTAGSIRSATEPLLLRERGQNLLRGRPSDAGQVDQRVLGARHLGDRVESGRDQLLAARELEREELDRSGQLWRRGARHLGWGAVPLPRRQLALGLGVHVLGEPMRESVLARMAEVRPDLTRVRADEVAQLHGLFGHSHRPSS